jgi:Type IV secretion system pilin
MKKIISFGLVLGGLPAIVFAADAFSIILVVQRILSIIIPLLITLAVVYFIWGVIQYTITTDEETKEGARGKIINGLVGLFVIVAFWGIIRLITNTFGVGPEQINSSAIPCIPAPGVNC